MSISKRWFSILSAALFVSAGSIVLADTKPTAPKSAAPAAKTADDTKKPVDAGAAGDTAKTADAPKTTHKPSTRLTKPWTDLSSLSDEQKTKILAIHHTELEEKKALEAKEKTDIMALLTPDQKKELKDLEAKSAADKKMKKPGGKMDDADDDDADDAKPAVSAPPATPAVTPAATPKKK